jgi:ssDNA-binding Zn-finger/Zn-ribbon topoisomerase 1
MAAFRRKSSVSAQQPNLRPGTRCLDCGSHLRSLYPFMFLLGYSEVPEKYHVFRYTHAAALRIACAGSTCVNCMSSDEGNIARRYAHAQALAGGKDVG